MQHTKSLRSVKLQVVSELDPELKSTSGSIFYLKRSF